MNPSRLRCPYAIIAGGPKYSPRNNSISSRHFLARNGEIPRQLREAAGGPPPCSRDRPTYMGQGDSQTARGHTPLLPAIRNRRDKCKGDRSNR